LNLSRRHFLSLATALPGIFAFRKQISISDDAFLEDLSHRAFLFFWEHGDPATGLVLDRARNDGTIVPGRNLEVASTALTGFGLTAMCIAADRQWTDPNLIQKRVRSTLRYFVRDQEHVRGWYYHFVNRKNGQRVWNSEISTIDTAMLLAGVITAQEYYAGDAEIFDLASLLYKRVDFEWLLNQDTGLLRMGWDPETGLFRSEWKAYDEEALLLLLGIGSPTHPIPAQSWYKPERQKARDRRLPLHRARPVVYSTIFAGLVTFEWPARRTAIRDGLLSELRNRDLCQPCLLPGSARNFPTLFRAIVGDHSFRQ